MSSPDLHPSLDPDERAVLLSVAEDSIRSGLEHGAPLEVAPLSYPPRLQEQRACFVTIEKGGELRGCVGSIDVTAPLVIDVANNAYAAAFRDPRFDPLKRSEFAQIELHISVLSPLTKMAVRSAEDLQEQLRPRVDGLLLQEHERSSTFLPSVWDVLAEPADFLHHLRLKGGWPADYWSDEMQVFSYTSECFP